MARDRKRAKQRRERRTPRGAPAAARTELHRADLPGALEHASSEVDEFDAALIRGAQGVPASSPAPAPPEPTDVEPTDVRPLDVEPTDSGPLDGEPDANGVSAELLPAGGSGGRGGRGGGNGLALEPAGDGGGAEGSGRALERGEHRRSLPVRAVAFLRASWAELQRVQWPDRPQVFQATAVVLGFVAVAGVYLGAADWVAQKIVNFVL